MNSLSYKCIFLICSTINDFYELVFVLQGWVTLQLTRDTGFSRGFMSARSVTGFLSDVYSAAADEVGKIQIIADERVCNWVSV